MEYLKRAADWGLEEKHRKERLAFLAAVPGDTAMRDLKKDVKWKPVFAAAGDFPQHSVRNLAALYLAEGLNLGDRPRPSWGEAEWSELPHRVRDALRHAP